jgi:hypothetical protein
VIEEAVTDSTDEDGSGYLSTMKLSGVSSGNVECSTFLNLHNLHIVEIMNDQ